MPTQQRSEATRAQILRSALACFAESGYDATGVSEICARAGVSKGAFYHHFASKQELFLALLDDWLAGLDSQLALSRGRAMRSDEELLAMAGSAGQMFQEAAGQLPMFLEFWAKAARDPAVWQATMAPYQRYRDFFAGMISDGVAGGVFRPVDLDTAARLMVAVALGLLLQAVLEPNGADWGRLTEESLRLVLEGLKKG